MTIFTLVGLIVLLLLLIEREAAMTLESKSPPSDLLGLRAWKASRTPSSIIRGRRAAQALASSRMAAKVAMDKLEARLIGARRVA